MTQNSSRGFIRTEQQAQIDAEALKLRSRGMTYREVAAFQGCTVSNAYERVKRALAAIPAEAVAEHRQLETEKLDAWEQATLRILERDHPHVTIKGDVAIDPRTGHVIMDDDPAMKAIHTLIKIQEQRAKLLGLYKPKELDVTITTYEGGGDVERELERLARTLAVRAGSSESLALGEGTSPAGTDTAEGRIVVHDDVQSGTRLG